MTSTNRKTTKRTLARIGLFGGTAAVLAAALLSYALHAIQARRAAAGPSPALQAQWDEAKRAAEQATIAHKAGDCKTAASLYYKASTLNPHDLESRQRYAECLVELGKTDQAFDYWRGNVMHPEFDTGPEKRSPVYDIPRLQEYAEAARHEHHPEEAQWAKKQLILALASYDPNHFSMTEDGIKALTPAQIDALATTAIGYGHFVRGEHDQAVASLQQAMKLNPKLGLAYYYMGMSLSRVPSARQAMRQAFQQAAKLDANLAPRI